MSEMMECLDCLGAASRGAARKITDAYDRALRPHGLRNTQFTLLTNLVLRGPTPVVTLARHLGLERTTLTRNLALLAAKGWVREDVDEKDARSRIVSVTPAGDSLAREAFKSWRAAQRQVSTILGERGVEAVRMASRSTFRG